MKLHTKQLTLAALTAAAYAVLSYFGSIFGITYGPIQCRFSEALCVLPFFLPETAWGLGVGCLIANLLSPYGVLDIVVGSAATLLAALLTARCQKKWLAPLPPVIANTVLIGLVLAYEQAGTSAAFGVRSVPTLLFIPARGMPQMATGALPKETLREAIGELLLKLPAAES